MQKSKKTSKKTQKPRKKRYFGIVKIKNGQKVCWIAKHDRNGWSIALGLNSRNVTLTGLRFSTKAEIERILGAAVVFVHRKDDPEDMA